MRAAIRPIRSADRVGRFFLGVRRMTPPDLRVEFTAVNGRAGALVFLNGKLDRVLTLEFEGERVKTVFIVRNPEKLRHLAPVIRG